MSLVHGTVIGNGHDIETWVTRYCESLHVPIKRLNVASDGNVFNLILYMHILLKGGNLQVVFGQIEVTEYSNGTADIRMWATVPDDSFGDKQNEFHNRFQTLDQMSGLFLEKFPYVTNQLLDKPDTGEGPQSVKQIGVNTGDGTSVSGDLSGRDKIVAGRDVVNAESGANVIIINQAPHPIDLQPAPKPNVDDSQLS